MFVVVSKIRRTERPRNVNWIQHECGGGPPPHSCWIQFTFRRSPPGGLRRPGRLNQNRGLEYQLARAEKTERKTERGRERGVESGTVEIQMTNEREVKKLCQNFSIISSPSALYLYQCLNRNPRLSELKSVSELKFPVIRSLLNIIVDRSKHIFKNPHFHRLVKINQECLEQQKQNPQLLLVHWTQPTILLQVLVH